LPLLVSEPVLILDNYFHILVGHILFSILLSLCFFSLFLLSDRLLAYCVNQLIRTCCGFGSEGDAFRLHIGSISLSIGLTACDIILREVVWTNPVDFQCYGKNFLHIKRFSLSVLTSSLCGMIFFDHPVLKIEHLFIDYCHIVLAIDLPTGRYNFQSALAFPPAPPGEIHSPTPTDEITPPNKITVEESKSAAPEDPRNRSSSTPPTYMQRLKFDVNSVVLSRIKLRLCNVMRVKTKTLRIPLTSLSRHDLTRNPSSSSESRFHRRPQDLFQVLHVIGERVALSMLASNKTAAVTFLSSAGVRQMLLQLLKLLPSLDRVPFVKTRSVSEGVEDPRH
jgi:hypothetical protein